MVRMNEGLSGRKDTPETTYKHDEKVVRVVGSPQVLVDNDSVRITDGQNEQQFEEIDTLMLESNDGSVLDITQADSQTKLPKVVLSQGDLELKCDQGTCVVLSGGATGKGDFVSVDFVAADFFEATNGFDGFRMVVHPDAYKRLTQIPQSAAMIMIHQAEGTTVTITSAAAEPMARPLERMPPIVFD